MANASARVKPTLYAMVDEFEVALPSLQSLPAAAPASSPPLGQLCLAYPFLMQRTFLTAVFLFAASATANATDPATLYCEMAAAQRCFFDESSDQTARSQGNTTNDYCVWQAQAECGE